MKTGFSFRLGRSPCGIKGLMDGGIQRFDRQKIAQKAQKFSLQSVGGLLHNIYKEVKSVT
jgi:hypothetical protein